MIRCIIEECVERAPKPTINIEHTLFMVKPDAIHKAHEMEDIILKSGFTVINVRYIIYVFIISTTSKTYFYN